MAESKKPQADTASIVSAIPPMVSVEEAANAILDYNATLRLSRSELVPLVWPCFFGGSGTGKTSRAYSIAAQRTKKLATVLLGTMLPEEFGGAGRAREMEGEKHLKFEWALPEFAFEDQLMLFMDELDKAERGHWASLLTALTSKTLRDRPFSEMSEFLCAMQPVPPSEFLADETGLALAARLCFLRTDAKASILHLQKRHGVKLDWFAPRGGEYELPVNLTTRGLDWLLGFARWNQSQPSPADAPENYRNSVLVTVASGMATREQVCALLDTVREAHETSPETLVRVLLKDPERVDRLPLPTLLIALPHIWSYPGMTLDVFERAMTRFLSETPLEEVGPTQEQIVEHLIERCNSNPEGQWIDVFGDADEKAVSEAVARASKAACKFRLKQIEDAKAQKE